VVKQAFAEQAHGVIPIRRTGESRALFLVHDGSGDVSYGDVLAPYVDEDVPLYGLPANPIEDAPLRTIHAYAKRLVRVIRGVQPAGPYRIAGWSLGCALAYEIATQLLGEDEPVEFLALIAPTASAESYELRAARADSMARTQSYLAACTDYRPGPIPVPVHVFRAQETPDSGEECHMRWFEALQEAHVRDVPLPGAYRPMLTPLHVEMLGTSLSAAMERAGAVRVSTPDGAPATLFTIQTGTGETSVCCVPGAGASVAAFSDLAAALGPDWPIHGLQPNGLDGTTVPHGSVTAAARAYVRALASASLRNPLHLLGHSFGGWVAFEMALQLRAAGRAVASVTIVDTDAPDDGGCAGAREYSRPEILLHLVRVFEQTAERSLDIVGGDFEPLDESARLELLHRRLVRVGIMPRRSTADTLRGVVTTFAAQLRATYAPALAYPGPVCLALVRDADEDEATCRKRHEEAAAGWRHFAPRMVTWRAPGNHLTVMRHPHVDTLATGCLKDFAVSSEMSLWPNAAPSHFAVAQR
jgi:thioesterase domain-containing protein